ncbi:SusC/RagA family TonB-linked outer membrane protein [Flavobacterium sp. 7A]|uniref:SusC/RagA family TonB-linked outer membrane protein n=1 Tax=Flavobacterium sp. 7A TaxID=2940571 RepID=UPI002226DBDA|nr:TonB-dependent receptor [Flavobacterium sp. 7A]MCW2120741.1 TonB-linked SusC/RagA family outer membrane protein [Flavobacterium sp. 7A]
MKINLLINWKLKTKIITMLLLFCFGVIQAQKVQMVTGTVTGEGGPLPGVSVLIKGGGNKSTITDFDGKYQIQAKETDVLTFSYIGFITQSAKLNSRTTINIDLKTTVNDLDEIVVIGYGTQKKKEVTGAVTKVSAEDLVRQTTSDLGNALQGQVAGLNVVSSSGTPGSQSNIIIRGFSSVLEGQNKPLFVVDGIPFDGDPGLSNSEIESVEVLKDVSSASIYGVRAAGGVILITTKQGKKGTMAIRVNSEYGVQHILSKNHFLTPEQESYVQLIQNESANSANIMGGITNNIEKIKSQLSNNTDISKNILQNNAPIQNHSINVSGGKEDLTYSLNTSLFKQDGVLINSGFTRFNIRSNTSFTKGNWKINTGVSFRRDEQQLGNNGLNLQILRYHSYQQSLDPNVELVDGVDDGIEGDRLASVARNLQISDNKNGNSTIGNIQADYKVSKSLSFTARGGATYTDFKRIRIIPKLNVYRTTGELVPENPISSNTTTSDTYSKLTGEFITNYKKSFGKHNLSVVLVASAQESDFSSFYATKQQNANPLITTLDNYTGSAIVGSNNNDYTSTLVGLLARVQYNYKGKYLFSSSIRRDASSQFAAGNRVGYFPSVSLGWNVSDEDFWKSIKNVANSFKFRVSYGETGNDRFKFSDYTSQSTVSPRQDYFFGTEATQSLAYGTSQLHYANEQVGWETSKEINIGYDLSFFKNKVTLTTDVYQSKKENLLFGIVLPPSSGVSGSNRDVIFNIGSMKNVGIEHALNYKFNAKSVKISTGITYTNNKNTVTKTPPENPFINLDNSYISNRDTNTDLVTVITPGYVAGAYFLLDSYGVIKNQAELDEYKALVPNANVKMGDLRYVDQPTIDTNNDGIPDKGDGYITQADRRYFGSALPKFEMGFNFSLDYKNFDMSMQWYGVYGSKVLNGTKAYAYQSLTHQDILYSWSPQNTNTDIPANRGVKTASYRGNSDYYLEDGSYIRLKNLTFGYSISKKRLSQTAFSKVRFYITAQNPFTLTKYTGYDPEVGNNGLSTRGLDRGNYPTVSQFNGGLQLQF